MRGVLFISISQLCRCRLKRERGKSFVKDTPSKTHCLKTHRVLSPLSEIKPSGEICVPAFPTISFFGISKIEGHARTNKVNRKLRDLLADTSEKNKMLTGSGLGGALRRANLLGDKNKTVGESTRALVLRDDYQRRRVFGVRVVSDQALLW